MSATFWNPGNSIYINQQVLQFNYDSIADLLTSDISNLSDGDLVTVGGYFTPGDGGGGVFQWDSTSLYAFCFLSHRTSQTGAIACVPGDYFVPIAGRTGSEVQVMVNYTGASAEIRKVHNYGTRDSGVIPSAPLSSIAGANNGALKVLTPASDGWKTFRPTTASQGAWIRIATDNVVDARLAGIFPGQLDNLSRFATLQYSLDSIGGGVIEFNLAGDYHTGQFVDFIGANCSDWKVWTDNITIKCIDGIRFYGDWLNGFSGSPGSIGLIPWDGSAGTLYVSNASSYQIDWTKAVAGATSLTLKVPANATKFRLGATYCLRAGAPTNDPQFAQYITLSSIDTVNGILYLNEPLYRSYTNALTPAASTTASTFTVPAIGASANVTFTVNRNFNNQANLYPSISLGDEQFQITAFNAGTLVATLLNTGSTSLAPGAIIPVGTNVHPLRGIFLEWMTQNCSIIKGEFYGTYKGADLNGCYNLNIDKTKIVNLNANASNTYNYTYEIDHSAHVLIKEAFIENIYATAGQISRSSTDVLFSKCRFKNSTFDVSEGCSDIKFHENEFASDYLISPPSGGGAMMSSGERSTNNFEFINNRVFAANFPLVWNNSDYQTLPPDKSIALAKIHGNQFTFLNCTNGMSWATIGPMDVANNSFRGNIAIMFLPYAGDEPSGSFAFHDNTVEGYFNSLFYSREKVWITDNTFIKLGIYDSNYSPFTQILNAFPSTILSDFSMAGNLFRGFAIGTNPIASAPFGSNTFGGGCDLSNNRFVDSIAPFPSYPVTVDFKDGTSFPNKYARDHKWGTMREFDEWHRYKSLVLDLGGTLSSTELAATRTLIQGIYSNSLQDLIIYLLPMCGGFAGCVAPLLGAGYPSGFQNDKVATLSGGIVTGYNIVNGGVGVSAGAAFIANNLARGEALGANTTVTAGVITAITANGSGYAYDPANPPTLLRVNGGTPSVEPIITCTIGNYFSSADYSLANGLVGDGLSKTVRMMMAADVDWTNVGFAVQVTQPPTGANTQSLIGVNQSFANLNINPTSKALGGLVSGTPALTGVNAGFYYTGGDGTTSLLYCDTSSDVDRTVSTTLASGFTTYVENNRIGVHVFGKGTVRSSQPGAAAPFESIEGLSNASIGMAAITKKLTLAQTQTLKTLFKTFCTTIGRTTQP